MKLIVVGGGTAGWLTSLLFQKFGNGYDVSIIESSEIGILGAGESSTPNLKGLLKDLSIDETDFLFKTNATIKTANHFVNWSVNDDSFYHKFNKLDNIFDANVKSHGFHFDARESAKYFKKIGVERGIIHIDGVISNFSQKENGDVSIIHLKDGRNIECDYIIDCSGFARLLIGNLYKSEWNSYSEFLSANSAIAYFLPQTDKIGKKTTQTQSIAMKYGWMWQVPLQHRWGCGYVYDDSYITDIEAKKEVEQNVGREIDIVKKFKFTAGSYKKTWVNNCISLGLASGFLEPLEGTSLMTLIWSIYELLRLGGIENENNREEYNDFVYNINYQSMVFVKHHYNCGRKDSEFWLNKYNSKNPKELNEIYDIGVDNLKPENLIKIMNAKHLLIFNTENYKVVNYGHNIKSKTKKTTI
jgi:tryptophan halogenase